MASTLKGCNSSITEYKDTKMSKLLGRDLQYLKNDQ